MNGHDRVAEILRKARAYWETRVLLTGAELDLFSLLAPSPRTAAEVSQAIAGDLRATEALLNALAAMEILVKEEGKFRVSPGLEQALSARAPGSILPMILHNVHGWERWSRLTDIVRTGMNDKLFAPVDSGDAVLASFIGAMHAIGQGVADAVVRRLGLANHRKMIDVGGGSGVYTIAALRAAPALSATIFDLPPVIGIAREKIAEAKLSARVTFAEGDYHADPLPGGHDLALLSAIIHANSVDQNLALYRKIAGALVPGGTIAVRDYVMDDGHTRPPDGALFAINMLVNTEGGGTYSFEEIRRGLEAAGFADVALLHQGAMDSLVTARKP